MTPLRWRATAMVGLVAATVVACGAESQPEEPLNVEALTSFVVDSLLEGWGEADQDRAIVVLSAATCLNCQNIGRVMRRELDLDRVLFVVPPEDSTAVAEYIQHEHIVAPLL